MPEFNVNVFVGHAGRLKLDRHERLARLARETSFHYGLMAVAHPAVAEYTRRRDDAAREALVHHAAIGLILSEAGVDEGDTVNLNLTQFRMERTAREATVIVGGKPTVIDVFAATYVGMAPMPGQDDDLDIRDADDDTALTHDELTERRAEFAASR